MAISFLVSLRPTRTQPSVLSAHHSPSHHFVGWYKIAAITVAATGGLCGTRSCTHRVARPLTFPAPPPAPRDGPCSSERRSHPLDRRPRAPRYTAQEFLTPARAQ